MTQVPGSQKESSPRKAPKNLTVVLAGAAFGVFVVVLQSIFAAPPASVFSSQDRPRGPEWFVSLFHLLQLIYSLPMQVFYLFLFAAILIFRPNSKYAYASSFVVGFGIPTILFRLAHFVIGAPQ
jgi:ABC-type Fe3+-siderophore transport system permease subunit